MKITIAWNVWNNHDDVLLASEIVRYDNKINSVFDKIELISQGGYDIPPNVRQQKHLDQYYHITARKGLYMLEKHSKYVGGYRILDGIKNAYYHALKNNSDYAVVTNGDAWLFSLEKLKVVLNRADITGSAISARVGKMTGMLLNYGRYAPYFDDHFLILNVRKCKKHSVFNYDAPKAYNANFAEFGGIHYMLGCLMDERVPQGMFNSYTDMNDCINHYGEQSGLSILPFQYQPSFDFLHANCQQDVNLHPLRSEYIRHFGFAELPECKKYYHQYGGELNKIRLVGGMPCFKKSLMDIIFIWLVMNLNQFYAFILKKGVHRKVINSDSALKFSSMIEYEKSSHILQINLASRRHKIK